MMNEGHPFPFGNICTPEQLGAAVRARRRELGLTQDDLAGLSGVGLRFLGELERGKATIQLGKTLQILGDLGLELEVRPREVSG
jgi:y4mF family transcriptional regulator